MQTLYCLLKPNLLTSGPWWYVQVPKYITDPEYSPMKLPGFSPTSSMSLVGLGHRVTLEAILRGSIYVAMFRGGAHCLFTHACDLKADVAMFRGGAHCLFTHECDLKANVAMFRGGAHCLFTHACDLKADVAMFRGGAHCLFTRVT